MYILYMVTFQNCVPFLKVEFTVMTYHIIPTTLPLKLRFRKVPKKDWTSWGGAVVMSADEVQILRFYVGVGQNLKIRVSRITSIKNSPYLNVINHKATEDIHILHEMALACGLKYTS